MSLDKANANPSRPRLHFELKLAANKRGISKLFQASPSETASSSIALHPSDCTHKDERFMQDLGRIILNAGNSENRSYQLKREVAKLISNHPGAQAICRFSYNYLGRISGSRAEILNKLEKIYMDLYTKSVRDEIRTCGWQKSFLLLINSINSALDLSRDEYHMRNPTGCPVGKVGRDFQLKLAVIIKFIPPDELKEIELGLKSKGFDKFFDLYKEVKCPSNQEKTALDVTWKKAQPSNKQTSQGSEIKIGMRGNLMNFNDLTTNKEKLVWIQDNITKDDANKILDKLTNSSSDQLLTGNLDAVFKWLDKNRDSLKKDDIHISDPNGLFVKQALYHIVAEAEYLVTYCKNMTDPYVRQIIKYAVNSQQHAHELLCALKYPSNEANTNSGKKNTQELELIRVLTSKKRLVKEIESDCLADWPSLSLMEFEILTGNQKLEWVENNIDTTQAMAILYALDGGFDYRGLSPKASHLYAWLDAHLKNDPDAQNAKNVLFGKVFNSWNDQCKLNWMKDNIHPQQACDILQALDGDFSNYDHNTFLYASTLVYDWLKMCKNSQFKRQVMDELRKISLPSLSFDKLNDKEKLAWIKTNISPEEAFLILHRSDYTIDNKSHNNGLTILSAEQSNAYNNWYGSLESKVQPIEKYLVNSKSTSWLSSFRNVGLRQIKTCLFEKAKATSAAAIKAKINDRYLKHIFTNQLNPNISTARDPQVLSETPIMDNPPSYTQHLAQTVNSDKKMQSNAELTKQPLTMQKEKSQLGKTGQGFYNPYETDVPQSQLLSENIQQQTNSKAAGQGFYNPYLIPENDLQLINASAQSHDRIISGLPSYEQATDTTSRQPLVFPEVPKYDPRQTSTTLPQSRIYA